MYKTPSNLPLPIPGLPKAYGSLSWRQNTEIYPIQSNNSMNFNNQAQDMNTKTIEEIDAEMGKRYFVEEVNSRCCYGKQAANECEIINIKNFKALYV